MKLFFFVVCACLVWCANSFGIQSSPLSNTVWIEMPASVRQFPVLKSTTGKAVIECGAKGDAQAWRISQWRNIPSKSICAPVSKVAETKHQECPGAVWERGSETMRACYWSGERRFRMEVDGYRMPYGGCCPECDEAWKRNPGGYAVKLGWIGKDMPDFRSGKHYWLRNLKAIIVDTGFAPEKFRGIPCPPNVPVPQRRGKKAMLTPVAWAHANLTFAQIDPTTSKHIRNIIFGTYLWDSRQGWSSKKKSFINCDFPIGSGRSSVIILPVTRYDYQIDGTPLQEIEQEEHDNQVYSTPRRFEWDLLPTMREELQTCLGSDADMTKMKLIHASFGIETRNSTEVISFFVNPKIGLVMKDGMDVL